MVRLRWVRIAVFIVLAACGRSHFDPCGAIDATSDTTNDGTAEPGLLLHYAFDSDGPYRDRVGHSDAVCSAGCPLVIGGRVGDGAFAFGGNDCLRVPDALDLHPAVFTFSAWVSITIAQHAIFFGRPYFGSTMSTNTFQLVVESSGLWGAYVGPGVAVVNDSTGWHHLAGVFDNTTLKLYVDGIPVSNPVSGAAQYANDDFLIGCDLDINVQFGFLTGSIDDVRLYGRALSDAELAALAQM